MRSGSLIYLAAWLDGEALTGLLRNLCAEANIDTLDLPEGLRRRSTGEEVFWFNYTNEVRDIGDLNLAPLEVKRLKR